MFGGSLKFGKVFGIAVDIHYSLLFIAFFLIYSLTMVTFPQSAPGYTESEYLFFGGFTSILFFLSILFHELAHGVMAQVFQVQVKRIVLFFMGGIAEIENEPQNANQEFWIAFVGPLSSFLLGIGFLGLHQLFQRGSLLAEMMLWLGLINVMLAAFNLLPGFPLDGGRVLRAFLWWTTRNHLSATRWTTYSGQAMGYLSIIGGILLFAMVPNPDAKLNGIWGLALGFFLIFASQPYLRSAARRSRLQGIPIGQVVQRQTYLEPQWPLAYAMDVIVMHGPYAALPVRKDGELIGFLTLDILRALRQMNWGGLTVEMFMRPIDSIQQIDAQRDLYEIILDQNLNMEKYLLVISDQRPLGLLTQQEILAFAQRRTQGI